MVASSFEELKQQIEHSTSVQLAAAQLIKDLAERLDEIAKHPRPEEIRKLAQDMKQHADALASAIALHAEKEGEEEAEDK